MRLEELRVIICENEHEVKALPFYMYFLGYVEQVPYSISGLTYGVFKLDHRNKTFKLNPRKASGAALWVLEKYLETQPIYINDISIISTNHNRNRKNTLDKLASLGYKNTTGRTSKDLENTSFLQFILDHKNKAFSCKLRTTVMTEVIARDVFGIISQAFTRVLPTKYVYEELF